MARAKAAVERAGAAGGTTVGPARAGRATRAKRPAGADGAAARVAVRPAFERRYRQTVRHVDLWSVLKIALCFYLAALIIVLASGMVLWWIASAAGVVGNIEDFVGQLIGSEDFEFLSWELLRASTLIGLVIVCLLVVSSVVAAALYNLFSDVVGGVEVTVVEEEAVPQ